ncbi:hypothetical protein ES703_42392 [subsurface metagenome]
MNVAGVAATLMANLQELAGFLCGLEHLFSAFECVGHLLFAIDVQPGFETGNSVLGVPKIRRGNYDGVKVFFLIEHFLVVHISIMLVAIGFECA